MSIGLVILNGAERSEESSPCPFLDSSTLRSGSQNDTLEKQNA